MSIVVFPVQKQTAWWVEIVHPEVHCLLLEQEEYQAGIYLMSLVVYRPSLLSSHSLLEYSTVSIES